MNHTYLQKIQSYREAVEVVKREIFMRNAPIIDVTPEIPEVVVNHNLTGRQISYLAVKDKKRQYVDVKGQPGCTRAHPMRPAKIKTTFSTGPRTGSNFSYWLTSISVKPGYSSVTVYIAKVYPVNTCEYQVTQQI